jgi:hypothetical protein
MRLLVCGLHRSGTSAVARLLADSCERSFLEDPDWAMTGHLIDVPRHVDELARWELVKCPRMTEVLPAALSACAEARAAVLVRDPRDVLCSILEKVRAGMPTRMLEFSRLGVHAGGPVGFAQAYRVYADTVLGVLNGADGVRVRLVVYERFCEDKAGAVIAVAGWIGWPCDPSVIASRLHEQLGPVHTKHPADQSVKGPRRFTRELDEADRVALAPALEAYAALLARA